MNVLEHMSLGSRRSGGLPLPSMAATLAPTQILTTSAITTLATTLFDLDAKAEYYRQKKAEFAAAGPTLLNPCDITKEMMKAEEQKWEL